MKFHMIDAFKGADGKICEHSDMGATYIPRIGKTFSHKLCNKRDLQALPYTEKEIAVQTAFKTRSAVISAACKSLSDEDRKALLRLRNARRLFSIRQLVEDLYDKTSNTVPAAALAELIAQGKKGINANTNTGGSGNANPGGSGNGSGSGNTSGSGSGSGGGTTPTPGDDSGDIA